MLEHGLAHRERHRAREVRAVIPPPRPARHAHLEHVPDVEEERVPRRAHRERRPARAPAAHQAGPAVLRNRVSTGAGRRAGGVRLVLLWGVGEAIA